jgi:hypothetical protein
MRRLTSLKILGIMGLLFFATFASADDGHQSASQGAGPASKQGQKWEADEALRQGMDDILRSMAASRADIEKECLNAHDYQRLADMVDRNATAIVKNCKLSKDADKAFHTIVLNDLTGGAQLMRSSPRLQAKRVGALGVLQSLRNYGEYFQHPDWSMGATK